MADDDRGALEAGKHWIGVPERWAPAKERWTPNGCSLCRFRPMDRGADHKARHERWARELATLERMYALPFTPNRRIVR